MVGQQMKSGEGPKDKVKITQDPLLCQHPSDKMLARGGRGGQQWWTCSACGSRFNRTPLSNYEAQSAGTCMGGNDIITFGKYTGDGACTQLKKFAKYIVSRGIPNPENIPAGRMDEEL